MKMRASTFFKDNKWHPVIHLYNDDNNEYQSRVLKKNLKGYSSFVENYVKEVIWRLKRFKGIFEKPDLNSLDFIKCSTCGDGPLIPIRDNSSGVDVICLNCGSEDEWSW